MIGNNSDPIGQLLQQMMGQMAQMDKDIPVREMKLPMDEGLKVTLESVPAEAFDESHTHVLPEMDAILLHLVPPEAQRFDERVTTFCEHYLADGPPIDSCGICGRGESHDEQLEDVTVQLGAEADPLEVPACARCRRNVEDNGVVWEKA